MLKNNLCKFVLVLCLIMCSFSFVYSEEIVLNVQNEIGEVNSDLNDYLLNETDYELVIIKDSSFIDDIGVLDGLNKAIANHGKEVDDNF